MKNKLTAFVGILGLAFGSFMVMSCEKKGPAEKVGEEIDDKTEDVKDKVEDVGDKVEDKIDKLDE